MQFLRGGISPFDFIWSETVTKNSALQFRIGLLLYKCTAGISTFPFLQFSNQAVKRILGDRVYAAYSLIFLSRARKEVSQSSQAKRAKAWKKVYHRRWWRCWQMSSMNRIKNLTISVCGHWISCPQFVSTKFSPFCCLKSFLSDLSWELFFETLRFVFKEEVKILLFSRLADNALLSVVDVQPNFLHFFQTLSFSGKLLLILNFPEIFVRKRHNQ